MIEKINDVYTDDQIEKLTDLAFTVKFKDIDLNKMRKADMIPIIGDLIEQLNKKPVSIIETLDFSEIDRLSNENNQLKQTITELQTELKTTNDKLLRSVKTMPRPGSFGMTTSILTTNDEVSKLGDGNGTWN